MVDNEIFNDSASRKNMENEDVIDGSQSTSNNGGDNNSSFRNNGVGEGIYSQFEEPNNSDSNDEDENVLSS